MAPRFATFGQQQNKALGHRTIGFELEPRSALRNIGDCTWTRKFFALDEHTRVVMELPARLFAQFGAVPELSDSNHRKGPREPSEFRTATDRSTVGKVH
jgi:hypothetical protein